MGGTGWPLGGTGWPLWAYRCALAQEGFAGERLAASTSSGFAAPVGSKATQPGPPRDDADVEDVLQRAKHEIHETLHGSLKRTGCRVPDHRAAL